MLHFVLGWIILYMSVFKSTAHGGGCVPVGIRRRIGTLSLEYYIKLYTMRQSLQHMSSTQHIIKKQWCDTNRMVVDDLSEG